MKKILFAATAAAMFIGCSQDLTSDITLGNGQNNGTDFYGGIAVEASAGETTRVTVDGDTAAAESRMAWEAGDEITIAYDGKTYIYIAQNAGASSTFAPKDADNAILAIDPAQDVAAYYNVTAVDAATKTADFAIAAEQHEGEASNKLPLYAYDESAKYADGKLVLKMNPLASIVEFEIKSSGDWNADALSLAPSARATFKGYTSVAGAKFNPRAEGEKIDLAGATVSTGAIDVVFDATKNFNGSKNVQVVVGAACFGGVPTLAEGAEGTPVYGGAVVKLYKKGHENFRRTIWTDEAKLVDLTAAYKHVYQPLSDILAGHRNGISTAEDMEAFANEINNSTEGFPVGTGFCNEDGVVVLNNDIDLSAIDNWTPVGYNNDTYKGVKPVFDGIFDGKGNTVSFMHITHRTTSHPIEFTDETGAKQTVYNNSAGLFGATGGNSEIRNLTVKGTILEDYTDPNATWSYVGGIDAQMCGGTITGCTSEVVVTVGENSSAKTRIGGIAGRVAAMYGDCKVENCSNKADLDIAFPAYKEQQAILGGCFGIIADDTEGHTIALSKCENHGAITLSQSGKDSYVAGIAGYITKTKGETGILDGMHNYGKVSGSNDQNATFCIGGIAGRANYHKLANCVNEKGADVTFTKDSTGSEYIGGIVGYTNGSATSTTTVFENCINNADVYVGATTANIGGIIGLMTYNGKLDGCINNGNISAGQSTTQPFVGGIAGKVGVSATGTADALLIYGCVNNGEVSCDTVCTGWSYVGGIAGALYGGTSVAVEDGFGAKIENCTNNSIVKMTGTQKSKYRSGGITGLTNRSYVKGCTHKGVIVIDRKSTVAEHIGGVVGFTEKSKSTIESCVNAGTVCITNSTTVAISLGGILGNGGDKNVTIDGCTAAGNILMATTADTKQSRGAVCGVTNAGIVIKNCKVGGKIGVVKNDGSYTADSSATFELSDDAGNTGYWEDWIIGNSVAPAYSNNSFYAGE